MSVQTFVIRITLFLVFLGVVKSGRNDPCDTPNKESAKCIPVAKCTIILDAIRTQNETAVKFAQDSQCGYDTEPLVCCGTSAYPTAPKVPDIFSIFTKAPPTSTNPPKQEQEAIILNNFNTKELPDRSVCGIEKEANRVVGGEITDLDEFPWMAALQYKVKIGKADAGIRCGGSLINNRYVLTAAHCIIDKEFELYSAWMGEWKISTDPDCQQLIAQNECADPVLKLLIIEQIPHPFYSKRAGNNDIGLIRLEKDVKYTNYIRPICLPPSNLPVPPFGTPMTVAGWGATENGSTSDIKLKVDVPLLTNTECNDILKSRPVTANQLCAGGLRGKDSCQGDSGGPLMRSYEDTLNQQTQWYQEGVVSWGVGCARAGYPAIYTRVTRYLNWIINQISVDG